MNLRLTLITVKLIGLKTIKNEYFLICFYKAIHQQIALI